MYDDKEGVVKTVSSISYIHPKKDTLRHRRVEYTITFIPSSREWQWEFSIATIATYRGTELTYDGAIATAKSMIEIGHPK